MFFQITVFVIMLPLPNHTVTPFTSKSPLFESDHPVHVQRRVTQVLEPLGRREFQLAIQLHEIQKPLDALIYPLTSSG